MFSEIEKEKDSAALFSRTRSILGWKHLGPPTCFHQDGRAVQGQKEIADIQATYYADKIKRIKEKLPQVNTDPLGILKRNFYRWIPTGGRPKFKFKITTDKEIAGIIGKMKNGHVFGIDELDSYIIKLGSPVLIPLISHIVNLSLCTATFPSRWKLAQILPLRKGKDTNPNNPSSYRPVSQLPVISKITERVVQRQILNYLERE